MRIRISFFWSAISIVLALSILNIYQSIEGLAANANNDTPDMKQELKDVSSEQENEDLFKVVIDPGHGGEDPGSKGASGLYEKDFTLSLSKRVVERIKENPNLKVFMTRDDDSFISAKERYRPKFANDLDADIYISIHGNTFTNSSVSGTETYYFKEESLEFASIIHQHLINATKFNDRGVKQEEYFVLKDTTMPAVLLEIGYLTNPKDEQTMFSDIFQETVADAIYEGILEYYEMQ